MVIKRNRRKLKKALGVTFIICLSLFALGATTPAYDNFTPPFRKPQMDITQSMNLEFDSLQKIYSRNKIIPKSLEKQIIFALSYFPELVDTKIEFRIVKGNNGIIAARPVYTSVLRSSNNRSYLVIINDTSVNRRIPSFINGTVNGQVGILGHELCHIVYFNNRTGLGLVGLGVAHVSTRYMDRFENKTDSMTIERGLGHQLIDWVDYLHKGFTEMFGPDAKLPFSDKPDRERYMSVSSIKRVMGRSKVYN